MMMFSRFAAGLLACSISLLLPTASFAQAQPKTATPVKSVKAATPAVNYQEIGPLDLVRTPDKYMNTPIRFKANFVSFSPYALDYKPAMRSSKNYISLLIQRPDVLHHTIPLSELKLILPRTQADKVADIEGGDQVQIQGKVFSSALGDPWVDVDQMTLVQKSAENLAKAAKKKKKSS